MRTMASPEECQQRPRARDPNILASDDSDSDREQSTSAVNLVLNKLIAFNH